MRGTINAPQNTVVATHTADATSNAVNAQPSPHESNAPSAASRQSTNQPTTPSTGALFSSEFESDEKNRIFTYAETTVPTVSPKIARRMLPGLCIEKTMMGIRFV